MNRLALFSFFCAVFFAFASAATVAVASDDGGDECTAECERLLSSCDVSCPPDSEACIESCQESFEKCIAQC